MPYYRFIIHGEGILTAEGSTGFYTTRWASAASEELAAQAALEEVREAWLSGEYAGWSPTQPTLTIDSDWEIAREEISSAPNRGSTFYSGDGEAN